MLGRSQTTKSVPINVSGSSTFGRYPKISVEKSVNFFISDEWLVPYAGYKTAASAAQYFGNAGKGRGIFTSTKFNRLVQVFDDRVYLTNIFYNQNTQKSVNISVVQIGTLETASGVVYITENLKPQIVISDNVHIYFYDPTLTPTFQIATADGTNPINFNPGQVDFHDTYILAAASNDNTYVPPANNTWRLGTIIASIPPNPLIDGKLAFPADNAHVGLLESKPDNTQAVVRFPSKSNMVIVMGSVVSEPWFDAGLQGFPYQRSNSYNIDYGCLNPDTIARNDEIVVWLAQNENSGPIIVYSTGTGFEKITTDGIDYLFSQLQAPSDSRAFLYRQDGHLFYHINFYTDNLSLFYDFNTKKFYHATDEKGNYFIADQVAFFNNQYYFVTRNNGNLYAFDTIFTTYDGIEIPRIRICKNIRLASQEYFIANDVGFTIEQGTTNYDQMDLGDIYWITEDDKFVITEGSVIFLTQETDAFDFLETETTDNLLIAEQTSNDFNYLIFEQNANSGYGPLSLPRVDLSISIDGGLMFGNNAPYYLNPIGKGKNKLLWWRLGAANDIVCRFEFWELGRFVCTDGLLNLRQ